MQRCLHSSLCFRPFPIQQQQPEQEMREGSTVGMQFAAGECILRYLPKRHERLSYSDVHKADKYSPVGQREKENNTFSWRYIYWTCREIINNMGSIELICCLKVSRAKKELFICTMRCFILNDGAY